MPLEPIQRAEFAVEVLHQRLMRERLSGDPLDEFRGGVAGAVSVDLFAEPFAERLKLAAGELPVQAAQVMVGLGKELRGVEVSQRIRRKITDQPCAPMDIL